jgi:protein phosphatase
VASRSDVGCQRTDNEDQSSYWEPASDEDCRNKGRFAIVADGMGGHEGGQVASRIAVETIEEIYMRPGRSDPKASLVQGFNIAHERIQQHASANPEYHGMGTTATAIVVLDRHLFYAHVGDSRLYLVRDGSISRVTHDHSYVGRLVETGVITEEEAESHPRRHILTAALGAGNELLPESAEGSTALKTGDVLVLCTDGLWGQVTDPEILEAVSGRTPSEACAKLIALARDRGGPDNITVQVLRLT